MANETIPIDAIPREFLSVKRNSRGYGWDFKIFINEGNDKEAMERLIAIDEFYKKRFRPEKEVGKEFKGYSDEES